ncbi:MAG: NAD(P)H-dependent oxidoreductase [Algicola sp.]|nr:NAD(P)H-dependent oxidoreductase [Algicola sp.]
MRNIVVFAGSNSRSSINKQLATYASTLLTDAEITILDLNDFKLPMYGIDKEKTDGIPENAHKFLEHIKNADGLIISLAEHNGAYTTAFKNLFDWMSRIESKTFYDKPMLLMAASPGARGGQSVLQIAMSRFPYHAANITGKFSLPSFGDNFDNGKISNQELNEQLLEEIQQFQDALS